MVVDVAPVGIPDRWHAVLSAAVARVGEADTRCRIGRREGEHAALRHERLDFARGELRPQAGGSGRVHKASRLSPRSGLRDDDDTRARAQERENPTGTQEHASSPQLRPRGGRRTSAVLAMAPFGNLLEPLDPGELVGSHPSGGSATPGTRRRRGTAPRTWAGFREATEVRASRTRMTDGPIFSWETETAGQPYCRCKTVQFGLTKT